MKPEPPFGTIEDVSLSGVPSASFRMYAPCEHGCGAAIPVSKQPQPPATDEWTMEFVAKLFCDGGFDAIAKVHNREIQRLNKL